MNIDLTRPELAELIILCSAADMNPVIVKMQHKAEEALKNFSKSDTPTEPNPDTKVASQQWRSPI